MGTEEPHVCFTDDLGRWAYGVIGSTLVVSQAWWDRSPEEERLATLRQIYNPFGRHYGWGPIPTEPFSETQHLALRAAWLALLGFSSDTAPPPAGRGYDPSAP